MKTQPKLNKPPQHPAVTRAVIQRIREMTPEQARAFLEKRDPGVEETWTAEESEEDLRVLEHVTVSTSPAVQS